MNPHMFGVPKALINFFLRYAVSKMWSCMIQGAEEIKDGLRPEHTQAMITKPEVYEHIQQRVDVMISRLQNNERSEKIT
jgi:hypothetical protein